MIVVVNDCHRTGDVTVIAHRAFRIPLGACLFEHVQHHTEAMLSSIGRSSQRFQVPQCARERRHRAPERPVRSAGRQVRVQVPWRGGQARRESFAESSRPGRRSARVERAPCELSEYRLAPGTTDAARSSSVMDRFRCWPLETTQAGTETAPARGRQLRKRDWLQQQLDRRNRRRCSSANMLRVHRHRSRRHQHPRAGVDGGVASKVLAVGAARLLLAQAGCRPCMKEKHGGVCDWWASTHKVRVCVRGERRCRSSPRPYMRSWTTKRWKVLHPANVQGTDDRILFFLRSARVIGHRL